MLNETTALSESVVVPVSGAIFIAFRSARNDKGNSPRRSHVDCRRRTPGDRARLLDQLHRHADFCEKQHAMVRPAIVDRRNSRFSSSQEVQVNGLGYCALKLLDQYL